MGIDYTHKKYGGEWGGNLISRPGKIKFREIKKGPQTGQTKMEKTKVHGTFKESGPPGTNLKLHKKASKRLNEIMRLKEKKRQTRTGPGTEKARKKRLSHLQSGGYKEGGRAGFKSGESVTRFRSSGPEGKPHSTKEGRSAEAQRAYMRKFGPQKPRRKTLAVTDPYKKIREKRKFTEAGFKPFRTSKQHGGRTRLLEELGRVEAEPSNRNRRAEISRVHGELNRGYKKGGRTGLKHGGSAGVAKRGHGAEIK